MEETWVSDSIAFISIETSIRTFTSLLEKISGVKFQKKEVDEAGSSFPRTKRVSDFAHLENWGLT